MPSTFSTNLKIELMATGENSGTWGTVTNTNLGTALEQAVVGYGNPNYSSDANLTITLTDSNAAQAARALVLNVTSGVSLSATRELVVPTIQKQYIVQNNTTGSQSITVKTSAGTGVTIPNGKKMHVYVDGTNVVQMDDFALIFNVDNLTLDGNTLSSTDTNGNIVIAPNGTGDVQLDADTVRVGDSNANATITTNGTGDLILNTNAGTNSGSITIEDGVNGNIIIAPNGTGQVQITNAALDLTTIEVSNINAKDGTAAITIADSTGAVGISTAVTMSATTQNIALGTSQTTGTWTAGGASQTGALTLDQSTKTHTLNLGTGATESGLTKTVNIGTGGVSTSTTAITIGSTNGTSTTLNGTVTAATLNSTTIDTTNIEVTNIKAKDGSASATIADSTGVMTIASSVLTTTDINGGTIDGTTIGGSTAAAGTFTTATATTGNITTVNATTVDTTNLEVTNIKAKDGTAALSIADSTGAVTVATALTANGGAVFNENGADVDFRVEGDTDANLFFVDASTDRVGIGVNPPAAKFHVESAGPIQSLLRTTGSTSYTSLRLYNDQGSSARSLEIDYSGSAYSGVLLTSGPSGEQATIATSGAYPLTLGTSNTGRISITSGGQVNIGGNFTSTNNTLQVTGNAAIGDTLAGPTDGLYVKGNVGIGTNSPNSYGASFKVLQVSASDTGIVQVTGTTNGVTNEISTTLTGGVPVGQVGTRTNHAVAFKTNDIEKMRLDTSGNLGLGVTPSAWSTGSSIKAFQNPGGAFWNFSTNNVYVGQNYYWDGTNRVYINTAAATEYNQGSGQHRWYTAPSGTAGNAITFTQALTLDANRNLLLNGTSAGASAVGTFAIFNGTAPTGSVTNGVILYAEDVSSSSELKVRDEAGNVTTLSPHNFSLIPEGPSEDMAWAYYSEKGGKRINVDMLKLARMVEKLTGEKLVYES